MAAPHVHEQIEGLARLGYAARGVVYLVVGWFAVTAAQGHNRPTDSKGALAELFEKPYGAVLLAVVALGLVGYALWRIVAAVADVDNCGTSAKGLLKRGGQVVAGIIHAGLAVYAVGMLAGRSANSNDGEAAMQDWTVWLMGMPAGQVLVGAVGVAIGGFALSQLYKAYDGSFLRTLACNGDTARFVKPIGRAGLAARGVVFLLVGAFFVLAAMHADSSEAGGMVKALRWLQTQPYGPWLLGVVALGLVAFGLFSFVQAVYRRIDSKRAVRRIDAMA